MLGTLIPRTGAFSHVGPAEEAGLQLAIADIDKAGGVLGQPVSLVDADSGDSFSSVASQSVDRMLARHVDAIVGATGSSVTLTVIDKVVGNGVVMVSPGDASEKLTGYPDRGLYARIVPPDTFAASTMARLLVTAGRKDVAVLYERDAYATGYAEDLQRDIAGGGGRVVAAIEYDGRSADFAGQAAQVAAAHPQAVAVIGTGEAADVVKALAKAGAGPQVAPLFVSDLALWPGLVQGLTPAQVVGVTGVRPGAAPSVQFLARLAAQAPDLTDIGYAAQTYDATVLVALAAAAAHSTRGSRIAAALPSLTTGSIPCSTYSTVRGADRGRADDRLQRAGRRGAAGQGRRAVDRDDGGVPVRGGRDLPAGRDLRVRDVPGRGRLSRGRPAGDLGPVSIGSRSRLFPARSDDP